jgi:calcium permeable stress-gated cation channel
MLIYHAYRYNFLFVYYLDIDTKGLCYARALQHLLLGIYMAEICLIGLFCIRAAIGPLIIVIFFFILSVLAHISLNDALTPLTNYLPRTLDIEEETLQSKEETEHLDRTEPRSRIQRFWKWIHPDLYRDYAHLRRKVRREPVPFQYSEKELAEAYFEPCIISATRNLWIPQDPGGLSKLEIQQTPSIIPISDTGAYLNEKNKIRWDKRNEDLPVWEKNPLY